MIHVFLLAALAFTLVRCAPLPAGSNGLAATVAVNSAASAAVAEVSHKELCYLEFLLETEATAVQFAKDQVIKDTDGRNVFLNDGFKSDSTGREVYYVSYCYASSSVKGSTSESKMGDSTTLSNPFADIIDGLGIQSNVGFGGRGGLLASLVGGSGGGTASGLLRKRQLFNGLGGLGGSSFGSSSPLDDNSFGSSLGGSPIGNSLSSPLSSSPLDALNGDSPTDNFDATKAIQGIGGSSDTLAGQSGLLGGDGGENAPAGRNYGDLGEGRGSGLFDDDARATTSSARENKPTGFHIRQSSVVESVLHSDSRNTNTRPSRLASATTRAAAPSSAASSVATNRPSSSSFVPVQLAQPGGPTIAVAIVSQPSPTATGTMGSPEQQYSIQTIQATAVH